MRLEKCILELLYHHDCVVVPQWGGLVANYRAARLNTVSHVISPPSKHIGFNRNLTTDDGLLAHHMGLVLGISHAEASAIISQEIASAKKDLQTNGRVVWDKLGIFYNDNNGSMQFMPQDQENFLLSSFGLHPIQLKAIRQPERPSIQAVDTPEPIRIDRRFNWKYAAAALLPIAVVGGLWWATQQGPTHGVNWASLNPWSPSLVTASYQPLPERTNWTIAPLDITKDQFQIGQKAEVTPHIEIPSNPKPNDHSGRYAVVGGAFKIAANATSFLDRLRAEGFDAQLVSSTSDIHLVAFGVYKSQAEAKNALLNIRSADGKSAWIKTLAHGK
jgi:hypothetical protein